MKLRKETVHRMMKLSFSAVILQLLYISLCISAHAAGGDAAELFPPLHKVPEMLEYASASCALTVIGGFVLEFADKLLER